MSGDVWLPRSSPWDGEPAEWGPRALRSCQRICIQRGPWPCLVDPWPGLTQGWQALPERPLAGGRDGMLWRKELGIPSLPHQTCPEVTVVWKLKGGHCGPSVGHGAVGAFVLKALTA